MNMNKVFDFRQGILLSFKVDSDQTSEEFQ